MNNMSKKQSKIEELKSKVETLKSKGTILKVKELEGQAFLIDITSALLVTGKYGEQVAIVGKIDENEMSLKSGEDVRLYLAGARRTHFEEAYTEPGLYAFVFGQSVELKSGHNYIPLELVESV